MSMIVETGLIVANANSYVSLADAATYATDRALIAWTGADAAKEAALIKATSYIDANYDFQGVINSTTQSLKWPRSGSTDNEGRLMLLVPRLVQEACIELAIVALSGDLIASPETAAIKRKKIKAGSVETETEYTSISGSSVDASPCPYADRLLSQLQAVPASNLGGSTAPLLVG